MQNAQALQKDNTAALKELRYKAPGLKQKEENFDITRAAKRCKTQVCGSEPLSGPSNNDITLPAKRESYFEKLLPAERESYYEKLTQKTKQLQRHFVKLSAKEKQLREELEGISRVEWEVHHKNYAEQKSSGHDSPRRSHDVPSPSSPTEMPEAEELTTPSPEPDYDTH